MLRARTLAKPYISTIRLPIRDLATDHKQQTTKERTDKHMKETYEALEMEVISFDDEDVIVTSYWGEEDPID